MIDASKPLSLLNQEVLKRLCTVSFTHNSLLYVALNKVDLVEPKIQLLQYSNKISELIWKTKISLLKSTNSLSLDQKEWENEDLFMISALQKDGTEDLLQALCKKAKPGEWKYAETIKSDLSDDKRANEIVREKVFKYLSGNVPFDMQTEVKGWKEENGLSSLQVVISVTLLGHIQYIGAEQ